MGLFGNIFKPLQGKLTAKQEENMKKVAEVFRQGKIIRPPLSGNWRQRKNSRKLFIHIITGSWAME